MEGVEEMKLEERDLLIKGIEVGHETQRCLIQIIKQQVEDLDTARSLLAEWLEASEEELMGGRNFEPRTKAARAASTTFLEVSQ